MKKKIPHALLRRLRAVKAKRPRTVIEHILKHGKITTEELKDRYGYDHPPRAARDVREEGIPLRTLKVKGKSGRTIAAYTIDLSGRMERLKIGGRKVIDRKVKGALLKKQDSRCAICGGKFAASHLQVDHRIPYEVGGEAKHSEPAAYMLVCRPCNRGKSWACEHCDNWKTIKKPRICMSCYWASPSQFGHVAMVDIRRLDLTWTGPETREFDEFILRCRSKGVELQERTKELIKRSLK